MFSARGFNIESLTVCETVDPTISRMTLSVDGLMVVVDQIRRQLEKLPEVIAIDDLSKDAAFVERELALVKLRPHDAEARVDLMRTSTDFNATTVDETPTTVTFEVVGRAVHITEFIALSRRNAEVVEVARSGVVALSQGATGQRDRFLEEVAAHER